MDRCDDCHKADWKLLISSPLPPPPPQHYIVVFRIHNALSNSVLFHPSMSTRMKAELVTFSPSPRPPILLWRKLGFREFKWFVQGCIAGDPSFLFPILVFIPLLSFISDVLWLPISPWWSNTQSACFEKHHPQIAQSRNFYNISYFNNILLQTLFH